MKLNKTSLSILSLLTVMVFSAFIPDKEGSGRTFLKNNPELRANLITTFMKNRLDLDKSQFDKAYQINLKYAHINQPQLEKMDPEVIGTDFQVDPQLKGQYQKRVEELKALLTSEQLKKWEEMRESMIHRLEKVLTALKENK